jgi:hypothetical protein
MKALVKEISFLLCKLRKKRRGRIKGGATTTTASSDVDFDVTGRRGRDECARGDGPA